MSNFFLMPPLQHKIINFVKRSSDKCFITIEWSRKSYTFLDHDLDHDHHLEGVYKSQALLKYSYKYANKTTSHDYFKRLRFFTMS